MIAYKFENRKEPSTLCFPRNRDVRNVVKSRRHVIFVCSIYHTLPCTRLIHICMFDLPHIAVHKTATILVLALRLADHPR